MKEDLKNLFGTDEEYITISDLSKSQKYSLEYLLNAANGGQLKAFKMGNDWLTTNDWFLDYQKRIKDEINLEISNGDEEDKWVGFSDGQGFKLVLMPQMVLILIIFCLFSFSLSWLVFHPHGHKLALSVAGITSQRHNIGTAFIRGTDVVYGWPLELVASANKYKISDEIITAKFHELIVIAKSSYQEVAGANHIKNQIYFDEWQKSVKE